MSIKIVLDTNVLIGFLIGKIGAEFERLLLSNEVDLLYSSELLEEFFDVLSRNKFQKYAVAEKLKLIEEAIEKFGKRIIVKTNVQLCRDPDDDFLLSICLDGGADYLITGDHDLLDLQNIGHTQIITFAQLRERLR